MELTLSNGQVIEILAINLLSNCFDWRRKEGYTGACMSSFTFTTLEEAETSILETLEKELNLVTTEVAETSEETLEEETINTEETII